MKNLNRRLLCLVVWGLSVMNCGGGACDNPNPTYDSTDPMSQPCLDVSSTGGAWSQNNRGESFFTTDISGNGTSSYAEQDASNSDYPFTNEDYGADDRYGSGGDTQSEAQEAPSSGNCCVEHNSKGCSDFTCESTVCGYDNYCCNEVWSDECASAAAIVCAFCGG